MLEQDENIIPLSDEDLGRKLAIELVDTSVPLNERYEAVGRMAREMLKDEFSPQDLTSAYLFGVHEWKARAEKAEIALENVRERIEAQLNLPIISQEEIAFSAALRMIANAADFEIIPYVPAQPLRVEIKK